MIPSPAQSFQDRREAAQLRAVFAAGDTAVLGQVLTGMGGVGKTQLAADYARTAWGDDALDLLCWITASSRSAVLAAYAQAAVDLCLADPTDPERAARAFLAWLTPKASRAPCRWLIVLDDLADPDDLNGLWPPFSSYGRTLVTTRRRDAALTGGSRRRIDVGLFSPAEAVTCLRTSLATHDRHEPETDLAALAQDLGHLPLALSQAAAYLVDSGEEASAYRELLADRTTALADTAPDRLPDEQAIPLAAAWSLSVERANTLRPVGLARPVLQLAALLDPNGIPQSVLTSAPVLDHLTRRRRTEPAVTEREVVTALRALHRLSLVDHNPGTPDQAVRVHQLIQRATRDGLRPRRRNELVLAAADALRAAWPAVGRGVTAAAVLRANAEALSRNGERALLRGTVHPVLFLTGESLGDTGHAKAATEYFDRLAVTARRHLGGGHPDSLAARRQAASWRAETGEFSGAVAALTLLLEDMLRNLGPDHHLTLVTRNGLAKWRGADNDPAGAATAFRSLVEDMRRVLGPDHPDTLQARNDLAWWQGQCGDLSGAISAYESLQADQTRVLGLYHPDTLLSGGNLAWCRGAAGDHAGALADLGPLLERTNQALGHDHRTSLATAHTRAFELGAAGDPAGGVAALEPVVERMLHALDRHHPDTFYARANLAMLRTEAGGAAGAVAALTPVLEEAVRALGPEHPVTEYVRDHLAGCADAAREADDGRTSRVD
ncbi:tetratricopeptide repeat protein [Streptomyces spiroverticillatus]|uniref:Tetratricopeptide repeat protein n=1 Tax=Streptomyces finlayi TaxID=67296 RepID=A0A918WSB8_9ACTN|nr:FxSxx-COOH system tetratricopeptide repeat protein [Streptomyces finlayi]GGZ86570.1 tetratricopeptide repeat protein [Streptomyces spiroverticillatus]GHC78085.1 tetratricopeptide repeat protein [Streptomyces finlayi]